MATGTRTTTETVTYQGLHAPPHGSLRPDIAAVFDLGVAGWSREQVSEMTLSTITYIGGDGEEYTVVNGAMYVPGFDLPEPTLTWTRDTINIIVDGITLETDAPSPSTLLLTDDSVGASFPYHPRMAARGRTPWNLFGSEARALEMVYAQLELRLARSGPWNTTLQRDNSGCTLASVSSAVAGQAPRSATALFGHSGAFIAPIAPDPPDPLVSSASLITPRACLYPAPPGEECQ
jgi:hypothetical protein